MRYYVMISIFLICFGASMSIRSIRIANEKERIHQCEYQMLRELVNKNKTTPLWVYASEIGICQMKDSEK